MSKPKSKVIKSKSSNSALRKEKKHTKTNSNVEFQTLQVKKRGIYVEKKATKISLSNNGTNQENESRPPQRPRGPKRYLHSVVTLVSKNTEATQNSDTCRSIPETKAVESPFVEESDIKKFRSRVLRRNYEETQKFQIIHPNKMLNIKCSLSNTSLKSDEHSSLDIKDDDNGAVNSQSSIVTQIYEEQNIKRSDYDPNTLDEQKHDKKLSHSNTSLKSNKFSTSDIKDDTNEVVNSLVKQIYEGQNIKGPDSDPKTLVEKKHDKQLYNFFVDLLETSFDVYNVDTDFNVASSRVSLEINESVAKKLTIDLKSDDDITLKPSFHIRDDYGMNSVYSDYYAQGARINASKPLTRRKLKSESFDKTAPILPEPKWKPKRKPAPQTNKRKNTKKDLLDLIKQQLTNVDISYAEPKNLYESLQLMARNKRKNEKSLQFDTTKEDEVGNCLKCRKVMTPKKIRYKPPEQEAYRNKAFPEKPKKIEKDLETNYSDRSLVVYGMDYDASDKKRAIESKFDYPMTKDSILSLLPDDLDLLDESGTSFFLR